MNPTNSINNPGIGNIRPESIMDMGVSNPLNPPPDDDSMNMAPPPQSPYTPNPWIANIDILYKILTVVLLALGSYIAWQVDIRVTQLETRIQGQLIDFERRISERFVDRRESQGMEHRLQRLEDRQWPTTRTNP